MSLTQHQVHNFETKTALDLLVKFPAAHAAAPVTDLVFSPHAKFLTSVGMDRAINIYQAPTTDGPSLKRQRA